jgi:hypothetical protein
MLQRPRQRRMDVYHQATLHASYICPLAQTLVASDAVGQVAVTAESILQHVLIGGRPQPFVTHAVRQTNVLKSGKISYVPT